MKIKNKVIVSNIVIVVILILTLLIIMGISIKSNNYHETIEEIIETLVKDKNSLYSVQNLIYQYEDDILSIPKSSYKNTTQKELESNQLSNLNQELSKLGYNLSIEVNNKNLYDNLTKQEHQKLSDSTC
nr:hypothetical protein [uncultured Intestinibacter sp.]